MPKSTFFVLQLDVVFTYFTGVVENFSPMMTWSLPVDQSERGSVRRTTRSENAWSVPWSSAIIKSDCELGDTMNI